MDVIVPKRTPLRVPRRQVLPSFGDLVLRCGKCGSRQFRLHVQPEAGTARLVEVVCEHCARVRKIDPQGRIDSHGKSEVCKNGSNHK